MKRICAFALSTMLMMSMPMNVTAENADKDAEDIITVTGRTDTAPNGYDRWIEGEVIDIIGDQLVLKQPTFCEILEDGSCDYSYSDSEDIICVKCPFGCEGISIGDTVSVVCEGEINNIFPVDNAVAVFNIRHPRDHKYSPVDDEAKTVDLEPDITITNLNNCSNVAVGDKGQFDIVVTDIGGLSLEVNMNYRSTDEGILKVSEDGKWEALSAGIVEIVCDPVFTDGSLEKIWDRYPGYAPYIDHLDVAREYRIKVSVCNRTCDVYRLYNPNSGEHFYTIDQKEKNRLVGYGWKYEGIGWVAPSESDRPVYRLYNKNGGEHHYTTNDFERFCLTTVGWKYEGIAFYGANENGFPIFREYNPNKWSCNHLYTANKAERNAVIGYGWIYEGRCWYGMYLS